MNRDSGSIEILSRHEGTFTSKNGKPFWQSELLGHDHYDRHKLVFKPDPRQHQPSIYKKGRGNNDSRRRYGGGTRHIDDENYNPRMAYRITVDILENKQISHSYSTQIQMDNKDMIRQEYINHYGIKRYGRGDDGNLPVPYRDEISLIPPRSEDFMGNPLSESQYGLMINDGMSRLIDRVARAFSNQVKHYQTVEPLKDLNNRPLNIPENKLWLSGGWRNPERNEWFSNALNGNHQRGGAVDIIAYEPPGDTNSAITYWILWNSLQNNKDNIEGFWQLETNERPMKTSEFSDDIEPRNGIPDAFDKADHLHINRMYSEE